MTYNMLSHFEGDGCATVYVGPVLLFNMDSCFGKARYMCWCQFVTSAKEVMFSHVFVCGFVSLFVCEQDNSKTYGRIMMKFSR